MMKFFLLTLSLILIALANSEPLRNQKKTKKKQKACKSKHFTCPTDDELSDPAHDFGGSVVIANRNAGTISLVNPKTLETVIEYKLPDDGEPMYFGYSHAKAEIWVGDRANNRLVILRMNGCDLELDGYVDTPEGLFHSMITQRSDVEYPIVVTTCDIDNVAVAHDLTTRRLLGMMERPPEAVKANAKPHDVTTNGYFIFITFLGGQDDGDGYVACYDGYDFSLLSVLKTKADPHVAIRDETSLFIAAQGGEVLKVSVPELEVMNRVELPSPHGTFISFDSKYLYITNIAEGGEMAVEVFDVDTGDKLDCPEINTSFPVPHNPSVSLDGKKIYITHSGATSTMNSAFKIDDDGCPKPHSEKIFETNLNPFGLFVLPPATDLLTCVNED